VGVEEDVRGLLRQRGAGTVEHPGGTLYEHLLRVHDRLTYLRLGPVVRMAGLAHAVYGTAGFDVVLLDLAERPVLRGLVGEQAEALVYRYGACDRRRTWDRLADTHEVWDRFTGRVEKLAAAQLRPFVDLTVVNELDVVEHAPAIAERHGAYLGELFRSWAGLASGQVTAEAGQALRC
jgi:hypothetical protein